MLTPVTLPPRPLCDRTSPCPDAKAPSAATSGPDPHAWAVGTVDLWPAPKMQLGARMFARAKYHSVEGQAHHAGRQVLLRAWRRFNDGLGGPLTATWRTDAGVTEALLLTAADSSHAHAALARWISQLFGALASRVDVCQALRHRVLDGAPLQRLAMCRAVNELCAAHVMSSQKRRLLLDALLALGDDADWAWTAAVARRAGWQRCTADERMAAFASMGGLAKDYPAAHQGWAHCRTWFEAGHRPTSGAIGDRLAALRLMLQTAPASATRQDVQHALHLCRALPRWSQYAASEQWRFVLRVSQMSRATATASFGYVQRSIGRVLPCAPGHLDKRAAWLDRIEHLSMVHQSHLASLLSQLLGRARNPEFAPKVVDALLQIPSDALLPLAQALRIAGCAQLTSELLAVAVEDFYGVSPSIRELVAHVVSKQLSPRMQQAQLRVCIAQSAHLARALEPWLASLPKDTQRDVILTMTRRDVSMPYQLCGLWAQLNPDTISHAGRRRFLEGVVQYARVKTTFHADNFVSLCLPVFTARIAEEVKLEIIGRMMIHPAPEQCREESLARARRRQQRRLNSSFSQLAADDENVMRHERIDASRQAIAYLRAHLPKPKIRKSISQFESYLEQIHPIGSQSPTATDVKNAVRVLRGKYRHGDLGMSIKENETLVLADERVGIADIFAWVWQGIALYMPQSGDLDEQAQNQANLRHSLVLNLAQCIESDEHRVCAVGISQRLLQVLQGYYPIHIDIITPQARLCLLTQEFADAHGTTEPQPEQLKSFYRQAVRLSLQWFTGVESAQFLRDLRSYMALTYDWTPTDPHDLRAGDSGQSVPNPTNLQAVACTLEAAVS